MKILITTLLLVGCLFSSEINFQKDLASAKKEAINQNKKLMIMYSAVGCPECNYMKKKVFKNKEIISFTNENYVSVIMDIQEHKADLPYKFIGIPTFYVTDAKDMKLLSQKIGGTREAQFLEFIKKSK